MSEHGDKIAEIAVGQLDDVYDRLDEEGKEMLLTATSSLVDQIIKMASTTDEEEIAVIKVNIGHLRGAIDNLVAISEIRIYKAVVKVLGDILAATIRSLI